ncbi:transcriptional regulator, LysR family [Pseudoxanthobacter soli DSM 19599]|uniref:Transcriptional regulator, LysR family n=1 Tax=Pseudoxanthobacter soli DSM 19599 TaxID=1123029 RepID=A0A1M7ZKS5_9HYPH|nr:LysR family transcriptional regulator [Pseudoxanthobacter soli]SHO65510.1 transcriptional regulator, LysR family [Pseudoxanthobacter soli DSM 19599]
MTLEQLRIFVAVAERQHVTRAARALNLAQSAASNAIAALESRHDTRLFDRVGRGIALTETGRAFLVEARAVLARAEAAEQVLSDFGALARGSISLHASQTIAGYWLPPRLVAFRREHPQIRIDLKVGNTAEVADAVESRSAELGFVEGAVDNPALVARRVALDQLVVIVAPDHPWASGRAIAPEDLPQSAWVMRESGSGTRSAFETALAARGIEPERLPVALELPSNEAVRAAVEAGAGAAAISGSVAAAGLEAGLIAAVDFPLPTRAFHVLHHRDREPSRAGGALLAALLPPSGGERRRKKAG